MDKDLEIVDFRRGLSGVQKEKIVPVETISSSMVAAAQATFMDSAGQVRKEEARGVDSTIVPDDCDCTVYEHKDFVGQ